jgi:hypothetical protein
MVEAEIAHEEIVAERPEIGRSKSDSPWRSKIPACDELRLKDSHLVENGHRSRTQGGVYLRRASGRSRTPSILDGRCDARRLSTGRSIRARSRYSDVILRLAAHGAD